MEISEDLLHHIWKYRLFKVPLLDMNDLPVELLDPGLHNLDSGPDFFNARILYEGILWAGNVEVHKKASQWYQHTHHLDPAFDNVILHVVLDPDCQVKNSKGREILTVKMEFARGIGLRYELMDLHMPDPSGIPICLEGLLIERLEERTQRIKLALNQCNGDWDEILYRSMARAFGQKTNADPFEMLARSVSMRQIREYCPDLLSKEAILFGQAGFLNSGRSGSDEGYYQELCARYHDLQLRLKLQSIDKYLWKFLRLRPGNFPTIRISQFACSLKKYPQLFEQLMDMADPTEFVLKMDIRASGYWSSHYRFHQESPAKEKPVGKSRRMGLLINAILPVLYAAHRIQGRYPGSLDISGILSRLPPEDNRIIRMWKTLGREVPDGFSSQALLQLTNKFFKFRRNL